MGKKNTYCRREINYENIEIFCIPIGDSHVGEIDPISLDLIRNSKKSIPNSKRLQNGWKSL
jgi:hypothetical protein